LKVQYGGPLSRFAFKFNLRRYTKVKFLAAEALRGVGGILVGRFKFML
jgi:hypothetical protein